MTCQLPPLEVGRPRASGNGGGPPTPDRDHTTSELPSPTSAAADLCSEDPFVTRRDQQVDRSDHSIAGVDRDLLRGSDGGVPCRPQACPDVSERFRRHLNLCPAEAPPFRMRKGMGLMVEAGPLRGLRVQRLIPHWHRTTAPTPARWQDRL